LTQVTLPCFRRIYDELQVALVCKDQDGDGIDECSDCDDADPNTYPGAPELCDGNGNTCSGGAPAVEQDGDGDGYVECSDWNDTQGDQPAVQGGGDCDDGAANLSPGLSEVCFDGLDNDCDPATPDAGDGDADGWECQEDCDDANPAIHPGASDICNGLDDDCSGAVDDAVCEAYDADGSGRVDGVELAWIGRAFTECSPTPDSAWWAGVNYTGDTCVNGDDLAVLASPGVFECAAGENVCP